jgi:prepilin-type N-terminal cleavage/methylation domain-containing protein
MTNQTRARRRAGRGFTMIEIMIVVGIIVILASIGLAVGLQVKRSSADQSTKATLKTLDMVMSGYLKDHPEPSVIDDDKEWVKKLQAAGNLPTSLKFSDDKQKVLDAYGNPILYVPSKANQPNGFFKSCGPDGVKDDLANRGNDDIFSEGASAQ